MKLLGLLVFSAFVINGVAHADFDEQWVNGYTRRDSVQVQGYNHSYPQNNTVGPTNNYNYTGHPKNESSFVGDRWSPATSPQSNNSLSPRSIGW